jgi:hypothetical protein
VLRRMTGGGARHERDPESYGILVADVVGYCRLAGADETRCVVRQWRALMLKSAICAIVFGAAFLAAHGAFAFEGRYVGGDRTYLQELTIKKSADGGFDVSAFVGKKGCAGSVDASGSAEGDTLKAEAENEVHGGTCVLTLRRTKTGLRVQEDNCIEFHGASCDFEGVYRKRR